MTDDSTNQHDIAWSPDSSRIVYVVDRNQGWELSIMNADGSGKQILRAFHAWIGHPSFNPDGTKIVFSTDTSLTPEYRYKTIWLWDGREAKTLYSGKADQAWPDYSPDGSRLAFASKEAGNFDIWLMKEDGTGLKRLTDSPEDEIAPEWSPDGKWIAYIRGGGVWKMRADGSRQVKLVSANASDRLSWSGEFIAYASKEGGIFNIWGTNENGTRKLKLTNLSSNTGDPGFSPDGKRLAYTTVSRGNRSIWVMDFSNYEAPLADTPAPPTPPPATVEEKAISWTVIGAILIVVILPVAWAIFRALFR
ncbi:MAG TPA: hypothetical protein HA257_06830 [Candidatus Methanoperedenaceae archaeon]|nr:hypothetical protein [Candidatus Methanoperedenaceae archaeon]